MNIEEIKRICKQYEIKNYTINADGTIDVEGDVHLSHQGLTKLPLQFGKVSGNFNCYGCYISSENRFTSLEGCPNYVGGNFSCVANFFKTLKGCPNYVGGMFDCRSNLLTTLEFSPKYVGGLYYCNSNELASLDGLGEVVGKLYVDGNIDLKSYLRNKRIADVLA